MFPFCRLQVASAVLLGAVTGRSYLTVQQYKTQCSHDGPKVGQLKTLWSPFQYQHGVRPSTCKAALQRCELWIEYGGSPIGQFLYLQYVIQKFTMYFSVYFGNRLTDFLATTYINVYKLCYELRFIFVCRFYYGDRDKY
jgi:hypothetical protein